MKKTTVTIGIPAYNEESNIKILLESILLQKTEGFVIKKILLMLDGSTDNTFGKAKEVSDKRIIIFNDKKRVGQSQRINEIIKKCNSDILVLLDGDILLANERSIKELIKPLDNNPQIGLTSGYAYPKEAKTFVEESVNLSVRAYLNLRLEINGGDNIFSCVGRSLALSRKFYRLVKIPGKIFASDAYLYLFCISKNFKFKYARSAKLIFRSPFSLKDQMYQNVRFLKSGDNLIPFFGNLVKEEYFIPKKLIIKYLLIEFCKNPIHAIAIFFINALCRVLIKIKSEDQKIKWDVSSSTKEIINYE